MLNKPVKKHSTQYFIKNTSNTSNNKLIARQSKYNKQFDSILTDKIDTQGKPQVKKNNLKNSNVTNSNLNFKQKLNEKKLDVEKNSDIIYQVIENNELFETFQKVLDLLNINIEDLIPENSDLEKFLNLENLNLVLAKIQEIITNNKLKYDLNYINSISNQLENLLVNLKMYNNNKEIQSFISLINQTISEINSLENSNKSIDMKKISEEFKKNQNTERKAPFKNNSVVEIIANVDKSKVASSFESVKNFDLQNTYIIELENEKFVSFDKLEQLSNSSNTKVLSKIFNQVIENVKINISENISEMVIKLKPDNLGNLSMKIVIERGILIAKFDVESQIVKQAIEANLEDLRSALNDKGFEIKEFNVSVNQDSNHSQNLFNSYRKNKSKKVVLNTKQIETNFYEKSQTQSLSLNSTFDYLA